MSTNTPQGIDLFSPYTLGPLQMRNRIVMAPLTRSRAEKDNVPSSMAATYYRQRATAGLVITEATQAAAGGQGYISTPGVHSQEQVQRWKEITDAVHQEGGLIFVQLWHVGRISHPVFRNGELPVAPSPIAPRGVQTYTADGFRTCRRREHSRPPKSLASWRNSGKQRSMRRPRASMASKSTGPMGICWTSFSRTARTSVRTTMAAAWKTGPACCSR